MHNTEVKRLRKKGKVNTENAAVPQNRPPLRSVQCLPILPVHPSPVQSRRQRRCCRQPPKQQRKKHCRVKLGQPSTELSGGEAQRIKLATELSKRGTGKTIYVLDEPTTGLHFADVHKLVEILRKLSDGGNTVVVIEHNLDVIKTADYIIDMGPEGGDGGGTVIAQGTPEEICKVPESYTGQFLKPYLESKNV